ncbi:MAG: hypothetical protein IJD23_04350 [Spirochaetaceae bacterium]|nr:hypothetical protein [Spirochaetaceae bacterium]
MKNYYLNNIYNTKLIPLKSQLFFPYQNCQKILLESHGLEYSELYINSSLSLNYNMKNNAIYSSYGSYSLLPFLESNVKQFYFDDNLEMVTEIFVQNIEYLTRNKQPIIVAVDSFYLNYSSNYKKKHSLHSIILCGYNLSEGKIYIVDFENLYYVRRCVSLENFLRARNSKFLCSTTLGTSKYINNNWSFIDKIQCIPDKKLFTELLKITIQNYDISNKNNYILTGIDALYCIKCIFTSSSTVKFYNNLYFNLLKISKRYILFNEILDIYRNKINSLVLYDTINIINHQIYNWNYLLTCIKKYINNKNVNLLATVEREFNELIENEKKLKLNIYKLYKEINSEYY